MGRDHAAPVAAVGQKLKKQSKAEKAAACASLVGGGKLCSPNSPQSNASTAASTTTLARSPEFGKAGLLLPELSPLKLPEALDALKSGASGTCAVCGGLQAAAGLVHLYSCENPHHNHNFLSCSDRCAKKFEKECSKVSEIRRKQPMAKRHAGQLSCPRCHFPITADQVTQGNGVEVAGAGLEPGAVVQEPPPADNSFVPVKLLPSSDYRVAREPRPRPAPLQEATLDYSEEPRRSRSFKRQEEVLMEILEAEQVQEETQAGSSAPTALEQQELEEARQIVSETSEQLAELEERLAQLPGQKNRKERNEVNQRIVALKNQPEVLAAERLVRDPVAERKRREREARAREAESERNAKVQDVVRSRLWEAVEHSGGDAERGGEEQWSRLLREGRTSGLSADDKALLAVQGMLDAIHEKRRLQEECQLAQKAMKDYVARLVCGVLVRVAERERQQRRPRRPPAKPSAEGRWQGLAPQPRGGKAPGSYATKAGVTSRGADGGRASAFGQAYKTQMCYRFELDTCQYGANCTYAHGIEELRTRSWPTGEQRPWQQRQSNPRPPRQQRPKDEERGEAAAAAESQEPPGAGTAPTGRALPPWRRDRAAREVQAAGAERQSKHHGADGMAAILRGFRLPPPMPRLQEEEGRPQQHRS